MRHLVNAILLLPGLSCSALAGEVQHASVDFEDGYYSVDISVKVNGDRDIIYTIATNYEQLDRLSDRIIESALVERVDPNGEKVVRRRLVTKSCVWAFCFDAVLIEDLRETEHGTIRSEFVPLQSDFLYGEALWQIQSVDETSSMITFISKFKPGFWVPPLIGPLLLKRMMLDAAIQTIDNIEAIALSEQSRP